MICVFWHENKQSWKVSSKSVTMREQLGSMVTDLVLSVNFACTDFTHVSMFHNKNEFWPFNQVKLKLVVKQYNTIKYQKLIS